MLLLLKMRPRAAHLSPSFLPSLRLAPLSYIAPSNNRNRNRNRNSNNNRNNSPLLLLHNHHHHKRALFSHSAAMRDNFSAIVVGAGAGGIAVVGNLLDSLPSSTTATSSSSSSTSSTSSSPPSPSPSIPSSLAVPTSPRIAWVDPSFRGGRISAKYREVPSNTKVNLFLEYAGATGVFRDVLVQTPTPNAVSRLQKLPGDETCPLGYAGDMLQQLTDGMALDERIESVRGRVTRAAWDDETALWTVTIRDGVDGNEAEAEGGGSVVETHTAPMLVYCTGASPNTVTLPVSAPPYHLDLDIALTPSMLSETIPSDRPITVGVVGASHSAVLVLMNLLALAQSSHPSLRVRWFTRHATLKFAEYKDGWILYDNTGLKGHAAQFARDQLDGANLVTSDAGKFITRVDCSGGPAQERDAFLRELPGCDHVVQAVGYANEPLPQMDASVKFDHETGGFVDADTGAAVKGLFGAGIAFPERVVDKAGNVEYAVGFWKFMRFLKKVVPQWVEKSQ
jgi:hypothetical protein